MSTAERTQDDIADELDASGSAVRSIDQLPDYLYHGRPEWSVSQFKMLPEEPELFYGRHILKLEDYQHPPSPQMNLGSAMHEAVLQHIELRIIPEGVLSKSGSKAGNAWKEFAEEHKGEAWLKENEAEPAKRAIDAVWQNRKARALLELPGDVERAIFWTDEFTGLRLRGRLDKYCNIGNGFILDLKTAADPGLYGFPFACLDRKYHVQAATYLYGCGQISGTTPDGFAFIAVQLEPPYKCVVYQADREMLDLGYTRMKESLLDLRDRLDTNNWYSDTHNRVVTLSLPKKAYQQL